jgi:hypothetical protein
MHVPFSHQLVIAETEDPIPPICHPIMRGSIDKDFNWDPEVLVPV